MKKEFAGTLLTSFGMMGTVHFSLELPGSIIGDTNRFLEAVVGRQVLVTVEAEEAGS